GAGGDHHPAHSVALDVHAEDCLGMLISFVGALGQLHAAGLAAASDLHLSRDDDDAANLLSGCLRFFWCLRHDAGQHGYSVCLKKIARLVLIQVHGWCPSASKSSSLDESQLCLHEPVRQLTFSTGA